MNTKTLLASALAIFSLTACSPSSKEAKKDTYKPTFQIQDCDVKLGGIHFTKMINGADKQVSQTDTIIRFIAPEGTLSLQKKAIRLNNQGKTMIAKDSFVPLL